jgi:DMSO/TMAO reductase YedYZ molybdopterin-dependent catalytic subunit
MSPSGIRVDDRSTVLGSRRELMRLSLMTIGLAATAGRIGPLAWFEEGDTVVPFTDVPATFTTRRTDRPEEHPGQNVTAQDLRKLESWITPASDYFTVLHYPIPTIDQAVFRLTIGGMVARPMTLTLDDIKRRPRVERTVAFECGGNSRGRFHGMVGNATWVGADLRALIREAKPAAGARETYFWGADVGKETIRNAEYEQNFARSLPLDEALSVGAILAYEMNGQPLPVAHGFPVRLVVPGFYGVCNVKFLDRIELAKDRLMTRFMARDYVTLSSREVNGRTEWVERSVTRMRVKSAVARVTRRGERLKVFGVAWTDGTPLKSVDVRVDDGTWQQATIDRQDNPHAWAFWSLETAVPRAGEHTIVSKATDRQGGTQPDNLATKKTIWENNELFVRKVMVS